MLFKDYTTGPVRMTEGNASESERESEASPGSLWIYLKTNGIPGADTVLIEKWFGIITIMT